MIKKKTLALTLFTSLLILNACGGGGGGDGDDSQPLSNNACSVLGLSTRIINGTACGEGSAVLKLQIIGTQFQGSCSGTLVAPNKVLTAAHCVLEGSEYQTTVPANSVTVSTGNAGQPLARSRSIQAPFLRDDIIEISNNLDNQDPNSPDFLTDFQKEILASGLRDVAIIELDRNLDLPTLPIVTSFLPDSGEVFSIFGFGLTDPNGTAATNVVYSGQMRVEESHVDNISSIFDTAGSDTCKGDSGGPAIIETDSGPAVVGVTSLGFGNCEPGETSVFAHTAGGAADFLKSAASNATFR